MEFGKGRVIYTLAGFMSNIDDVDIFNCFFEKYGKDSFEGLCIDRHGSSKIEGSFMGSRRIMKFDKNYFDRPTEKTFYALRKEGELWMGNYTVLSLPDEEEGGMGDVIAKINMLTFPEKSIEKISGLRGELFERRYGVKHFLSNHKNL